VTTALARLLNSAPLLLVGALTATAVAGCGSTSTNGQPAQADPGITSSTLTLGGDFPLSGPLAGFGGPISTGIRARFDLANALGGIKGRKINFTALDDAYDPARATANARQLVQQTKAFAVLEFGDPSAAVSPYMEKSGVPFIAITSTTGLADTATHKWTRSWQDELQYEGTQTAKQALIADPAAKVGVLALSSIADDLVAGIKKGLGANGSQLVDVEKFQPADTDHSAYVTRLKASGVTALISTVYGPVGAKTLGYLGQIGWQPTIYNNPTTSSKAALLDQAGPAAKGLNSLLWLADPADPATARDPALADYYAAVAKLPGGDAKLLSTLVGWTLADTLVQLMRGMDTLTRTSLVKAWDATKGLAIPGLAPGTTLDAGADGRLIHAYLPARYDGTSWVPAGKVLTAP